MKKKEKNNVVSINDNVIKLEKPTRAQDFPIEEYAMQFVEMSKTILDKQSIEYLYDSLRGLSFMMQQNMCIRIIDYFLFGEIVTTGVKHVDGMIKEIINKFPFDHRLVKYISQGN